MKKNILFILFLLLGLQLAAAVPPLINYQGRLTGPDGAPLTGTKSFALSLHDAATEGTLLYSETIGDVTLGKNGVYSFRFGAAGTIDGEAASIAGALSGSGEHWLQLSIDGVVQSTRERILAVPFALQAASVLDPVPLKELRFTRQFKGELSVSMKETLLNSSEGINHQVSFPVPAAAGTLVGFSASIAGVGGLPNADHSDITSAVNLKVVRLNADMSTEILFETTQPGRSGGYEDYLPFDVDLDTALDAGSDYYLVLNLSYTRGNGNTGSDYVRFQNFPKLTYRK